MSNDQPQIQGVPPGVTLEPVQQSSTPAIQGVPAGVTLEPIQSSTAVGTVGGQPFDPSSGQSYADVAARHARSRQGIPQEELSVMDSYTPLAGESGFKGAVVGAGKAGLQT